MSDYDVPNYQPGNYQPTTGGAVQGGSSGGSYDVPDYQPGNYQPSVPTTVVTTPAVLSPPAMLPSMLGLGLMALSGNMISVAGVPVLIFAPSLEIDNLGNVLPAEYVPQNLSTTIYANIVTDQESQDAANALLITSPRPAYAYLPSCAGPMLFNRGLIYDGTNYWIIHQTPVPYQMGIGVFVWRVLVTQQQQTPAGIP